MSGELASPAGHRRQLILFLVAIVVPFVVLVALSAGLVMQDRELRVDQGGYQRRQRAGEARKEILERLEAIRRDEILERLEAGQRYRHSETAFVGWVDDQRLVLPWEAEQAPPDPAFQERIRPCEQAEFGGQGGQGAAGCYEQAVRSAKDPAQAAYARLLWSRVLDRSGRAEAAVEQLSGLLDVAPGFADEDGVPIRFYAAQRLAQLGLSTDRVVARTQEALAARPWLPPLACFVVSDIAERLGRGNLDRRQVEELRRLAGLHVRLSEQAESLQGDFARTVSIGEP
ncbi:MAG: hypothetical protein NTY38_02500, partial [Acidobacteria bacterium]|nr:hypothetical protein [Acidobacteriota bacterium]